jgi:hypothetical protein
MQCIACDRTAVTEQPDLTPVPVAPALYAYVENRTVAVYRAPQPLLLSHDLRRHLVETSLSPARDRHRRIRFANG